MLFKKISVLSCLLFVCVLHAHSDYKQLPEDDYLYQGNINLGFDQYKSKRSINPCCLA